MPQAADAAQAMAAARLAAQVASDAFPSPMSLAFERVAHPLMLLQVNK